LAKKTTDPQVLDAMKKDKDSDIRWWAAVNQNITSKTLSVMKDDKSSEVRYAVAESLNATPEILDIMKDDKDSAVRYAVAENPNATPEILDYLKDDEYRYVRRNVAKNLNTSSETLSYLTKDKYKENRDTAKGNLIIKNGTFDEKETLALQTKNQALLGILSDIDDNDLKRAVAYNNKTNCHILNKIAKSGDRSVVATVANNVQINKETIEWIIANHNDAHILNLVAKNPNTPKIIAKKLIQINKIKEKKNDK
jgi:3-methyladenine DNA glycosylase AlkC